MKRIEITLVISLLLFSLVTMIGNVSAEENKVHNVDIIFGSSNVENGRFYNPSIVKIKVGDSVSWMNLDKDPHTVTDGTVDSQWGKVFDSKLMRQGKEFRFKFTEPGEYQYLCALHPWMIGKVVVEDPIANSVPSSDITVREKLNVFINSEKQSYYEDEIVRFTVEVVGAGNKPTDPDTIEVQFGAEESSPVTISRVDVGKYVYSTTELKPASYNLSVKVSKENFESGSSTLTIHVVKKEIVDEPIKIEPLISIEPDQKRYYAGDVVTMSGSITRAIEGKSVVFQVFDSNEKLFTRGQALINPDGTFEWSFKVSDKASGTWTVKTKYLDDAASTSFEIINLNQASMSKPKNEPLVSVPEIKFKEEKVGIVRSAITDQTNSQLYEVRKEQSVMIQSEIKNNAETQQTFAYITQIKNSNGIVVKLEAVEGVLSPSKTSTIGISWTPDKSGSYTIEVFVWKSLEEPIPLSLNIVDAEINVQ